MKTHGFLYLLHGSSIAFAFVPNANKPRLPSKLFEAPEVLAEEGVWQAYLDEDTTGLVYYFNSQTGESLWEPPTNTFPEVRLPRKKQRLADDLRREYRRSIELDEESETDDSNWFSGIFDQVKAAATVEEETFVEEENAAPAASWFDGFAAGMQKEISTEEVTEAPVEAEAESDWLGGFFEKSATKEEKPETEEKKEVSKSSNIFDTFAGKKQQDETPVAQQPKVMTEPGKKKDPKIGGVVKKPITGGTRTATPKVEVRAAPIKIDIASNILPHPAKVRAHNEYL